MNGIRIFSYVNLMRKEILWAKIFTWINSYPSNFLDARFIFKSKTFKNISCTNNDSGLVVDTTSLYKVIRLIGIKDSLVEAKLWIGRKAKPWIGRKAKPRSDSAGSTRAEILFKTHKRAPLNNFIERLQKLDISI